MNKFRFFVGLTRFRPLSTAVPKVPQVSRKHLLRFNPNSFCVIKLDDQIIRNMSQKSITSFFKSTPKKANETRETSQQVTSPSTPESGADVTPKVNGKAKAKIKRKKSDSSNSYTSNTANSPKLNGKTTTKRQRTISSDDESPKASKRKSSPFSSEKKRQTKRLRIESSGSEADESETKPVIKSESETKPVTKSESETKPVIKSESETKPVTKSKSQTKNVTKKEKSVSPKKPADKPKKAVQKATPVKKEKDDDVKVELPTEETYNPFKAKYHPVTDACWSKGEEVPYLALAKTLEAIEAISARLKIVEILSNYFRSVLVLTPDDLLPSVYMCLNQLAPAYHSLELGIAETYLMKAIGQSTGRTLAQVKNAAQKSGDLGLVAEQARSTQRTMFQPPPLKVRKVFQVLKEIANMTGQASVNKKISKIQQLYIACRHSEARYLIRSLEGKLRIGLAEQSVLQALALATVMTPPGPDGVEVLDASKGLSAEQFKEKLDKQALLIKTTYCECPNYDLIIPALLKYGVSKLPEHCRLTPGIPLKPMLAHPTKGLHEVFNRFENQEFTCEYKYDGERAQIHVPGDTKADIDKASIFSRNQENNTSKYPDILSRLHKLLKDDVTSCVLDTEAVAYDVEKKQILPFQILSTRKRKDANQSEIKVQVCVFVFDLLYLNGRPLVKEPLSERRDLLRKHFNEVEGEWHFATSKDCTSMEEVQLFLDESIKGSCEGLMVKMLKGENAKYDIARRSHNWLKLKKDYLDGIGDTIDAVVIGAYAGKGKRAGVYGGFLLACLDSTSEEYQALCKLGTGFSDEDLKTLTEQLKEHVVDSPKSYYRYDSSHSPDTWFSPTCVWEVRCADLSLSPAHRAAIGLVDPDKGISLRFPRFVRVRDDKTPEQATTAQQIAEMYLSQDQVKNTGSKVTNYDDFY